MPRIYNLARVKDNEDYFELDHSRNYGGPSGLEAFLKGGKPRVFFNSIPIFVDHDNGDSMILKYGTVLIHETEIVNCDRELSTHGVEGIVVPSERGTGRRFLYNSDTHHIELRRVYPLIPFDVLAAEVGLKWPKHRDDDPEQIPIARKLAGLFANGRIKLVAFTRSFIADDLYRLTLEIRGAMVTFDRQPPAPRKYDCTWKIIRN